MRIVVTGSSGCLAQVLVPALCEQPFVTEVTGVDWHQAQFSHPKFRHVKLDIRDPQLKTVMDTHDAVIHLAFLVAQGSFSNEEMRQINVDGSAHVVDCARDIGVRKFVNLSSVSVYGPGENRVETDHPVPHGWFAYAAHKRAVEQYVEQQIPHAVQFRAHLIFGAKAQKFLRDIFRLPVWLDFGHTPPRQQVAHENDVADAILAALQRDVSGYYNLASPEVIAIGGNFLQKAREEGRQVRRVPFSVVRGIARMGRVLIKKDLLTLVSMLDTTATVNCDKATRELGWRAKRTAWDARVDSMKAGAD